MAFESVLLQEKGATEKSIYKWEDERRTSKSSSKLWLNENIHNIINCDIETFNLYATESSCYFGESESIFADAGRGEVWVI